MLFIKKVQIIGIFDQIKRSSHQTELVRSGGLHFDLSSFCHEHEGVGVGVPHFVGEVKLFDFLVVQVGSDPIFR